MFDIRCVGTSEVTRHVNHVVASATTLAGAIHKAKVRKAEFRVVNGPDAYGYDYHVFPEGESTPDKRVWPEQTPLPELPEAGEVRRIVIGYSAEGEDAGWSYYDLETGEALPLPAVHGPLSDLLHTELDISKMPAHVIVELLRKRGYTEIEVRQRVGEGFA